MRSTSEAQKLGRTKYYETYDIQVCDIRYEGALRPEEDAKARA